MSPSSLKQTEPTNPAPSGLHLKAPGAHHSDPQDKTAETQRTLSRVVEFHSAMAAEAWRGVRGSPWARHLLPRGRTPASGLITWQDLLIFRSCPSQTTGAGSGTTSFTLSVGSPSLWVYEPRHVPTLSSGNPIREEVINLIFKKPGCCKWKSKFIPKIKWGNSCSL